jgi:hypothetical protein
LAFVVVRGIVHDQPEVSPHPCRLNKKLGVSTGSLALITSDWFYHDLVRHVPAAAPDSYVPSRVVLKETDVMAWIRLPDNQWAPPPPPSPDKRRRLK